MFRALFAMVVVVVKEREREREREKKKCEYLVMCTTPSMCIILGKMLAHTKP
jgi:hypothetical protein